MGDNSYHGNYYEFSKTKNYKVIFQLEEQELKSIECNCIKQSLLKWCRHKVAVMVYYIQFFNKIIHQNDIKQSLKELSKEELENLLLEEALKDNISLSKILKKSNNRKNEIFGLENYIKALDDILTLESHNFEFIDLLEKFMNEFDILWKKEEYFTCLNSLKIITNLIIDHTNSERSDHVIISKIWMQYITKDELPQNTRSKFTESILEWWKKGRLDGNSEISSNKFYQCYVLSNSNWDEPFLKSILNGEFIDGDLITDDFNTLISRALILKSKKQDYSKLFYYIILKMWDNEYIDYSKIIEEIEYLSPVFASYFHMHLFNYDVKSLEYILKLNQNTFEERNNNGCKSLKIISCLKTIDQIEYHKFPNKDLFLIFQLNEELQKLIFFYLTARSKNISKKDRVFNIITKYKEFDFLYHYMIHNHKEFKVFNFTEHDFLIPFIQRGKEDILLFINLFINDLRSSLIRSLIQYLYIFRFYEESFLVGIVLIIKKTHKYHHFEEIYQIIKASIPNIHQNIIKNSIKEYLSQLNLYFIYRFSNDLKDQKEYSPFIFHLLTYSLVERRDQFFEKKNYHLFSQIPTIILNIYSGLKGCLEKEDLKQISKFLFLQDQFLLFARIAKNEKWNELISEFIQKGFIENEQYNMKLMKIQNLEDELKIMNEFSDSLNSKSMASLSEKIMMKEPTTSNFDLLLRFDPKKSKKLEDYLKNPEKFTVETIPLLFKTENYDSIKIIAQKNQNLKSLSIIINESIKTDMMFTEFSIFFSDIISLIIKNDFTINNTCNESLNPNDPFDSIIIQVLKNSTYQKSLGLFLLKEKTFLVARKLPTATNSYNTFIIWLNYVKNYYSKDQEWNKFLKEICLIENISRKTVLKDNLNKLIQK